MAREEYTDRLCQVAFVHFQFMKEAIIFLQGAITVSINQQGVLKMH